jgi:hypothetical protein
MHMKALELNVIQEMATMKTVLSEASHAHEPAALDRKGIPLY